MAGEFGLEGLKGRWPSPSGSVEAAKLFTRKSVVQDTEKQGSLTENGEGKGQPRSESLKPREILRLLYSECSARHRRLNHNMPLAVTTETFSNQGKV